MGVVVSARSVAKGKEVMSDLASISAQMAEVKAEQADLDERRHELQERERELWAKWTKIFAAEAGSENPVDLRTTARRRRPIVPRKTVPVTPEMDARAELVLANNDHKRSQK